jgi:hypothetical protein
LAAILTLAACSYDENFCAEGLRPTLAPARAAPEVRGVPA